MIYDKPSILFLGSVYPAAIKVFFVPKPSLNMSCRLYDPDQKGIRDQFIYDYSGISDDKCYVFLISVICEIMIDFDEIRCLKIFISDDPFIHRFYDQFR